MLKKKSLYDNMTVFTSEEVDSQEKGCQCVGTGINSAKKRDIVDANFWLNVFVSTVESTWTKKKC